MIERKFFVETGIGKNEIADYLLAMKHDARATTIRYLKDITQEELDWQPYEGWNSVAALLAHIIAGEKYFNTVFVNGRVFSELEEAEITPGLQLGKYAKDIKGNPIGYYLAQLEAGYKESRTEIAGMKAEAFLQRRFEYYDKVNGSDMAWILYHAVEDEVHHRGQISIIRKLYKEMKAKQA